MRRLKHVNMVRVYRRLQLRAFKLCQLIRLSLLPLKVSSPTLGLACRASASSLKRAKSSFPSHFVPKNIILPACISLNRIDFPSRSFVGWGRCGAVGGGTGTGSILRIRRWNPRQRAVNCGAPPHFERPEGVDERLLDER